MNRYLGSFFITTCFYVLCSMSVLYMLMDEKIATKEKQESTKIKFAFITKKQEVIVKPEPIKQEIQKEKIAKKPEIKPIKRVVKKVQKIEPIKRKVEEVVVQKEQIKQEKKEIAFVKEEPIKEDIVQVKQNNSKHEQAKMLLALKELIEKNKSYPSFARKANIQGSVKVCFTISKEGKLISLQIKDGKRVFHKSAENAIRKSLPFPVDKGILTSSLTIDLEIIYNLI